MFASLDTAGILPSASDDAAFSSWDDSLELMSMFLQPPPPPTPPPLPSHHEHDDEVVLLPVSSNSSDNTDESNRTVNMTAAEERRQRRMISNRESARRSRQRKQRHLEDLRNQLNRLRVHNREASTHLEFVTHHCRLLRRDNERLRSESSILRRKLSEIHRILLFRQLQQFPRPPPPPSSSSAALRMLC